MSATATLMGEETGTVLVFLGACAAVAVPDGWALLPAGVVRRIRANRDWLYEYRGEKAWVVTGPDGTQTQYDAVKALGEVRFATGKESRENCGRMTDRPASWVETDGPLLVK